MSFYLLPVILVDQSAEFQTLLFNTFFWDSSPNLQFNDTMNMGFKQLRPHPNERAWEWQYINVHSLVKYLII